MGAMGFVIMIVNLNVTLQHVLALLSLSAGKNSAQVCKNVAKSRKSTRGSAHASRFGMTVPRQGGTGKKKGGGDKVSGNGIPHPPPFFSPLSHLLACTIPQRTQ